MTNEKQPITQELQDFREKIELSKKDLKYQSSTLSLLKELLKKNTQKDIRTELEGCIEELEEKPKETPDLYANYVNKYDLRELAIKIIVESITETAPNANQAAEISNNYCLLLVKRFTLKTLINGHKLL